MGNEGNCNPLPLENLEFPQVMSHGNEGNCHVLPVTNGEFA